MGAGVSLTAPLPELRVAGRRSPNVAERLCSGLLLCPHAWGVFRLRNGFFNQSEIRLEILEESMETVFSKAILAKLSRGVEECQPRNECVHGPSSTSKVQD